MEEADRRILYYLDLNCRCPIKRLASLSGIRPDKVEARLSHFFRKGIVKRCHPELNRAKLGCIPFKVYLQFQSTPPERMNEIYEYLCAQPNVGWVATCSGRWDMIFAVFSRGLAEFNAAYDRFLHRYHSCVLSKASTITLDYYLSNKAWLNEDAQRTAVVRGGGNPERMIDDEDERILTYLGNDGRAPILKISNALGIEANEVEARIKRMQKDGVIISFQTDLDMEQLGRVFCKSLIYLTRTSKREEERLMEFCFRHPEITTILRCVGPWDLEIEAYSSSSQSFTEIMYELRNRYSSLVRNFEAVVINKESGTMYLKKE